MKKLISIGALIAVSTISMSAAASDNTITFQGEVADNTCQVTVNGNAASPVVLLPTVSVADFAQTGDVAGETSFTISVAGCAASGSDVGLQTVFVPNGLSGDNMANNGTATGVSLQLLDAPGGAPVALVNGENAVPGLNLVAGETSASHDFAVQYHADEAIVAPGSVTSAVQYSVSYQ